MTMLGRLKSEIEMRKHRFGRNWGGGGGGGGRITTLYNMYYNLGHFFVNFAYSYYPVVVQPLLREQYKCIL